MPKPSLSVIIPNYNHSQFLPRSLGALGEQSGFLNEVIVVDDGSTDNSVEIVQQLAAKYPVIKLYRNEKNMGCPYSIDRGISLAQGDYFYFGAADDEVMPGLFDKSMKLLAQYPNAALCCTIGDFREEATGLRWFWGSKIAQSAGYLSPADLLEVEKRGDLYIPSNSVILKRDVFFAAGKFPPELKTAADWYTLQVLAFRHGMCFVPEPLAVFYIQPNSYYKRVHRDQAEHEQMLKDLLLRLHLPQNKDVLPLLREGGALYLYVTPMLRLLLSRPEYRHLITARYLRKMFVHASKLFLKEHAPKALVSLYLKCSPYRAKQDPSV